MAAWTLKKRVESIMFVEIIITRLIFKLLVYAYKLPCDAFGFSTFIFGFAPSGQGQTIFRQQIFVFFTKSIKRNKKLMDKLEEVENVLMLRNLSKTRWAARTESIQAVWRSLEAILEALVSLEGSKDQETKTKASAVLNAVHNIDFICGLMILKNIMLKAKMLSDHLQGETINVAGALIALSSTDAVLKRMRANDNEINDEIEAAVTVARNLGKDPEADFQRLHRVRKPSRRLDDNPTTATPELGNLIKN